jgi:hypothetical protein
MEIAQNMPDHPTIAPTERSNSPPMRSNVTIDATTPTSAATLR